MPLLIVRHESGLNILRPQERFSLFRDVLPERVGQIGRDVVPGFGGESIEKGPVFITDPKALYYGISVNDQSLTPGDNPRLGSTRFADWLSRNA